MTVRRETCTCGAASPAPSWSSMVSNMSSIRRWISGAPIASGETGSATCRRMGWPRCATLRTAMAPRVTDRRASRKLGFATPRHRRLHRRTPFPTASVADALLAASWAALVLDGVWQTRREHAARARLGPVVLRAWQPSVAAGLAVLVASLAGAVLLERALWRFAVRPAAARARLVVP